MDQQAPVSENELPPPKSDTLSEKGVHIVEDNDEGQVANEEASMEEEEEEEMSEEMEEEISCTSHETLYFKSQSYKFLMLFNPDIEEAFAYRADPPKVYEADGQELFRDSMENDNLVLIRRFYDSLKKEKIDLQFSRVDPRAMLPMSLALSRNSIVNEINLRGNRLTTDAAYHLAELILNNKVITSLNLSGCRLGPEGISKLGDALEFAIGLKFLDLSKNQLGDSGLECLVNGISYNGSIKYLNLSHNKLTHLSGPYLTDILIINSTITTLDLSWNDITQDSSLRKMLFSVGKLNESLERFIMQWNSLIGTNTASYFRNFLTRHKSIQELDLSHNRFCGDDPIEMFFKGVNSCESLLTLNLSFNPFTIENVGKLVLGISATSTLKHLILIDLWIRREDYDVAQEIHHGKLLIDVEGIRGIKKDAVKDITIQELLLKRCHYLGLKPKKKAKRREFGYFLMRMEEEGKLKPVKKSKFEEIVGREQLLLEAGLFVELTKWFKGEKNRVDLVLMLDMYKRLFPDVQLPKKKKRASDHVLVVEPDAEQIKNMIDSIIDELVVKSVLSTEEIPAVTGIDQTKGTTKSVSEGENQENIEGQGQGQGDERVEIMAADESKESNAKAQNDIAAVTQNGRASFKIDSSPTEEKNTTNTVLT